MAAAAPAPAPAQFQFAIDRGGTFTDVFARCPSRGGKVRVLKLLSEDPANYCDAPTEGIRRILEEVGQAGWLAPHELPRRGAGRWALCRRPASWSLGGYSPRRLWGALLLLGGR